MAKKQSSDSEKKQHRQTFTYEGKKYDVKAWSEKDLAVKVALKKKELEEGSIVITRNTTVERWAYEWLETYKADVMNPRYYKDTKNRLDSLILARIGHLKLKDVRAVHLQKIMNECGGMSDSYIDKVLFLIQQIFREARINKLILDDPSESLKRPKAAQKQERRSITETERKYLLQVADWHYAGLWIKLQLYCGLRPGEAAALTWNKVDLKKRIITIDQALKSDDTIGPPKSKAGHRKIPISSDDLYNHLSREQQKGFDFVCKNKDGGRHAKSTMKNAWKYIKREMNIAMGCKVFRNSLIPPLPVADDLVTYCLRHTFCTDLQEAGVSIDVARRLMGHEDIKTTSKIYTHYRDSILDDAAELMAGFQNRKVESKVENK